MKRLKLLLSLSVVTLIFGANLAMPLAAQEEMMVRVYPNEVGVDLQYGGANLIIDGITPSNTEVIVKVTAPAQEVRLSKKGPVAGIFYMTVERAKVENMPAFYFVLSSGPIQNLLTPEDEKRLCIDKYFECLTRVGEVTTDEKPSTKITNPDMQREYIFGLLDLKKSEKLYDIERGKVYVEDKDWSTSFHLPADAPVGKYTIESYAVNPNTKQVVAQAATTFEVKQVGLVDSLAKMAKENGLLYGILAVVLAIAAGLGVGFIFKEGGAH